MSEEKKDTVSRVKELITTFREDADEVVRFEAVQELLTFQEEAERAIPAFIESLQNETNYDVLYIVIGALGNFGPKSEKAVPELIELITNFYEDEEILQLIIETFSKIGKSAKRAEKPLKQIIVDYNERNMRIYAIQALERIIGSDIIPILSKIITNEEEDEIVRIESVKTIAKIGTKEVISRLHRALDKIQHEDVKVNIESVLGELGDTSIVPKLLTRLMESPQPYERAVAAEAFGKIKLKEAIPVLLETALNDGDVLVRAEAVKALGNINAKEATDLLIEILKKERNDDLRLEVIEAFGKLGGGEIIKALENVIEEESDDELRAQAIESLVEIGSSNSSTLLIALLYEDENLTVRKQAAKALGVIGTRVIVPALIDILNKDDEDEEIVAIVRDSLLKLGKKGNPSALIGIIRCCDDVDIREEATNSIVRMEHKKAIPELINLLKDEDTLVRSLAAFMLSEIGKKLGFEDYIQLTAAYKSGAIERNIAQRQVFYELEQRKKEILEKKQTDKDDLVLQKERETNLRKIIKRYSEISLERMVKLLKFKETLELEKWLLDLPDELAFKVQKDVIKIPQLLQSDSVEAEEAINTIINSFKKVSEYTCYYCGYPIENAYKLCPDCGETTIRCVVCKLPINFGEDIGFCSLCESKGHLTHLQEWVKTKGICPHCMQKIPMEGIVHLPTDKTPK